MAARKPISLTLSLLSVKGEREVSRVGVTVSSINSARIAKPMPNSDSQEFFMAISFSTPNTPDRRKRPLKVNRRVHLFTLALGY
jgi:hypothetical protein